MEVVEVFAGTPQCPTAQYVVLERIYSSSGYESGLFVVNESGQQVGDFMPSSSNASDPSSNYLLYARPKAAEAFGITPDGTVFAQWIPAPDGALYYVCGNVTRKLIYGNYPQANAPALVPGKALRRNGCKWELVDPAPRNSWGQVGSLIACTDGSSAHDASADAASADDASVNDASVNDAGETEDADGQAADDAQLDSIAPSDAASDGATFPSYPPCGNVGGAPGSGGNSGSGAKGGSGGIKDAGDGDDSDSGCACGVVGSDRDALALILALLALATCRRIARRI